MNLPKIDNEEDLIWPHYRALLDEVQRTPREKKHKSAWFRLRCVGAYVGDYLMYPYRSYKIRGMKKSAVILHLYYTDLANEFIKTLRRFTTPFDLFVTVCQKDGNVERLMKAFPHAKILVVPNRGRDVGPFVEVLNQMDLTQYEVVFKIHSKKVCLKNDDGKRNNIIKIMFNLPDGDAWRKELVSSFMGSAPIITRVLYLFRQYPRIGMVGGWKFHKSHGPLNPKEFFRLCYLWGLPHHYEFFAGTMFAIRASALAVLKDKHLTMADFPKEHGKMDGKLEDLVASVFGALCLAQNLSIKEV